MNLGACWNMGSLSGPASLKKTNFLPQLPSVANSFSHEEWDFTSLSLILYQLISESLNAPQRGSFLLMVSNTDSKPVKWEEEMAESSALKNDISATPTSLKAQELSWKMGQKDYKSQRKWVSTVK